MIDAIKKSFLENHQSWGFDIHDSFPLVIDDPTVLFTNATITPFKSMFTGARKRTNFALVQKCLRLGGASGNLETTRSNLNYTSIFEMLGSGLFNVSQDEAVAYFVNVLESIGLQKEKFVFTTVAGLDFEQSLARAGIEQRQVKVFTDPKKLQHEWSFGEGDLHGCGVVAWYVPNHLTVTSCDYVLQELSSYVQVGRIVHIDGFVRGETVEKFSYAAYDMGLGLGRVEFALTGGCEISLSSWRRLSRHFKSVFGTLSETDAHYMANLYRVIEDLVNEGLVPGSKKQAYALRKVVRLLIEEIWLSSEAIVDVNDMLEPFIAESPSHDLLRSVLQSEELALRRTLADAVQKQKKNPHMNEGELRATFGIRQGLLRL